MGTIPQKRGEKEKLIAIPLVHALLESKEEQAYTKVIEVTLSYASNAGVRVHHPQTVMNDFEVAIINSVVIHFGEDVIRLCLFHLCQSVYRKVQAEGLQQRYYDNADIRNAMHTMCALAFVPPDDVGHVFDLFYDKIPQEFAVIADYFEKVYVRGIPARGRRRAVKPRYHPRKWNQYTAVIQGTARTNNASEGWHNRLNRLVGKCHPSFYTFLQELQKEQADVEYIIREIGLGKKVNKVKPGKLQRVEERIANIVSMYENYAEDGREYEYIEAIGHNLHSANAV